MGKPSNRSKKPICVHRWYWSGTSLSRASGLARLYNPYLCYLYSFIILSDNGVVQLSSGSEGVLISRDPSKKRMLLTFSAKTLDKVKRARKFLRKFFKPINAHVVIFHLWSCRYTNLPTRCLMVDLFVCIWILCPAGGERRSTAERRRMIQDTIAGLDVKSLLLVGRQVAGNMR